MVMGGGVRDGEVELGGEGRGEGREGVGGGKRETEGRKGGRASERERGGREREIDR